MNITMLAEDATLSVQRQQDTASAQGVGAMAESMFMGQKYELGIVLACHGLSGLGHLIVRNIEAWIVTRFQGEDPRVIGNVLGLTPEQVERMRILRPGEIVIFNPVLWPKPVYATFPAPTIPGVCDESMQRAIAERFLAGVTTRPPAPLDVFRTKSVPSTTHAPTDTSTSSTGLPPDQLQMLVIIASGLPKTAGKVYEAMGLNRTQGRRLIKALEKAGLICAHRFSTGRVGGQMCFFQATGGWKILQSQGISKPAALTNGRFEHELAAQLLRAEARRSNFDVQFEVDCGGVRVDAVMTHKKTGQRIHCQIGVSKADREVDNIERFFALPAAQNGQFVLICRDAAFAREVKKLLKTRKVVNAIVKQVHVRLIADLVKE